MTQVMATLEVQLKTLHWTVQDFLDKLFTFSDF